MQLGKKICTGQFLVLGPKRFLHEIFKKSAPVPLGQFFLEATICADVSKTENAHISTGKSRMKTFNSSKKF